MRISFRAASMFSAVSLPSPLRLLKTRWSPSGSPNISRWSIGRDTALGLSLDPCVDARVRVLRGSMHAPRQISHYKHVRPSGSGELLEQIVEHRVALDVSSSPPGSDVSAGLLLSPRVVGQLRAGNERRGDPGRVDDPSHRGDIRIHL